MRALIEEIVMDMGQAIELEANRQQYFEVAGREPDNRPETELSLEERADLVKARLTALVDHSRNNSYKGLEITRAVPIATVEGPLPYISLRFKYFFGELTPHVPKEEREAYNEHGERIYSVTAEWIHSPEGPHKTAEPIDHISDINHLLEWGEVYATEFAVLEDSLSGKNTGIPKVPDAIAVARIEQSLDLYELAMQGV